MARIPASVSLNQSANEDIELITRHYRARGVPMSRSAVVRAALASHASDVRAARAAFGAD